jgi:hypothetical protein
MSTSTWTGAVNSHWHDADNWSPAGVPGAGSDVTITTGSPVASASIGTVNSITDSSDLSFESAGTNTVATFLDNAGSLDVDNNAGAGGTILNIGGTLTNGGALTIGNATLSASDKVTAAALDNTGKGSINLTGSGANQALLDVTGSAGFGTAGIFSGNADLSGDSAIEFANGEITSLAAGAHLGLNGNDAFVEDTTAPGSDSALIGLASIRFKANLDLENSASVTTGALSNEGRIELDAIAGDGGSSLTLAGALSNGRALDIGNTKLSASDKVTAAGLSSTGSIVLIGSGAAQALLDVTGSAGFGTTGVLSGDADLSGDSAIEFPSGQITSLAANAQLHLNGSDAFIEDTTAPGSNSALTELASVGAGATFYLENGASTTTGALANDGYVLVGPGGSSLTVAGALTNSNALGIAGGTVTAASLENTGSINLHDNGAGPALLDVTTGVAGFGTPGTVTGNVAVSYGSAIQFLTGQITTITASSQLTFSGGGFIEDSTVLGSESALTGLSDVAGALEMLSGAAVSTTGALDDSGSIGLDANIYGGGGTALSIGGALTITGALNIGNDFLYSSDSVTAASLINNGTIDLVGEIGVQGHGTNLAALNVSGATTGVGSFILSDATLQFGSAVSAGQTINEYGNLYVTDDALILDEAQKFAGTISGFGTGVTIDAANFLLSGTTFHFGENSGGTGGTLTLHDGSLTANILMTGVYTNSDFSLAPDSGTGTLVKFV